MLPCTLEISICDRNYKIKQLRLAKSYEQMLMIDIRGANKRLWTIGNHASSTGK